MLRDRARVAVLALVRDDVDLLQLRLDIAALRDLVADDLVLVLPRAFLTALQRLVLQFAIASRSSINTRTSFLVVYALHGNNTTMDSFAE